MSDFKRLLSLNAMANMYVSDLDALTAQVDQLSRIFISLDQTICRLERAMARGVRA